MCEYRFYDLVVSITIFGDLLSGVLRHRIDWKLFHGLVRSSAQSVKYFQPKIFIFRPGKITRCFFTINFCPAQYLSLFFSPGPFQANFMTRSLEDNIGIIKVLGSASWWTWVLGTCWHGAYVCDCGEGWGVVQGHGWWWRHWRQQRWRYMIMISLDNVLHHDNIMTSFAIYVTPILYTPTWFCPFQESYLLLTSFVILPSFVSSMTPSILTWYHAPI